MRHAARVSITSMPMLARASDAVRRGCGKALARAGAEHDQIGRARGDQFEVLGREQLEPTGFPGDHFAFGLDDQRRLEAASVDLDEALRRRR